MKLSAPIYQLKRRARQIARDRKVSLHEALDAIAREEGFARWSLLSARAVGDGASWTILPRLADGDLVLLGARPGQGKTMLGLRLLLEAAGQGRRAVLFTLEYTEAEARRHLRSLAGGATGLDDKLEVVTSNGICADLIISRLSGSKSGTVALIDYIQLLDQQRSKPALADQVRDLRAFARGSGVVLAFLSQIDRTFDPGTKLLPDVADIRLPNPVDLRLFSKACFLHGGAAKLLDLA